ncbi:MAG: hypothetical protein ACOH2T_21900, partial [Pseudomonas sp.]
AFAGFGAATDHQGNAAVDNGNISGAIRDAIRLITKTWRVTIRRDTCHTEMGGQVNYGKSGI